MRERYREGKGMEVAAGYCRAVRHGDVIVVSGTADFADGKVGHVGDTYGQAKAAFERSLEAIERVGGRPRDVVRTRVYLTPDADFDDFVRVHKELFGEIEPVNTTVVVAALATPEMLVEVEVDAVVAD